MKNLETIRRAAAQQVSRAAYLADQAQIARDQANAAEVVAIKYAAILPILKDFFDQTCDNHKPFADQRREFVQIIRAAAMECTNIVE